MPHFCTYPQLDERGQPKIRAYKMDRRFDRATDEFVGLAKGVRFYGILNQSGDRQECPLQMP